MGGVWVVQHRIWRRDNYNGCKGCIHRLSNFTSAAEQSTLRRAVDEAFLGDVATHLEDIASAVSCVPKDRARSREVFRYLLRKGTTEASLLPQVSCCRG